MRAFRSWLTPYQFVQNNPIGLIDPTGMLDTDPPPGWVPPMVTENAANEPQGMGPHQYPGELLNEIIVTPKSTSTSVPAASTPTTSGSSRNQRSGSSGSMCSGISIYRTGTNGVDNWNSGLNPLFFIDMNDPFWGAFFGWGQKEKYNDVIPGSDSSDDVKDMTKAVTDAVQVVVGMEDGGVTSMAPIRDFTQPTNPDTTFQINVRGKDGWYSLKDTTMSKSNASGFLKDKKSGVTPNVYR